MKSIKSISNLSAVSLAMAMAFASGGAFAQAQIAVVSPGSVTPGAVQPSTVVGTDNAGTAAIGSTVVGAGSVSMGYGIAIGNNASSGSRVNATPTYSSIAIGNFSVAAGDKNDIANVAVGNQAAAVDGSVAIGNQALGRGQNGVAIGAGAAISDGADGSVALGSGSVANTSNVVSVGSAGAERQIVNVATGVAATDAANTGQVSAVAAVAATAQATANHAHIRIDNLDLKTNQHTTQISQHTTQINNLDQRVVVNEADISVLQKQDVVHSAQIQNLMTGGANDGAARSAIEQTNSRVDQLRDQISANRKEAAAGVAGTAAMVAAMPVAGSLEAGQTAMGVGLGNYAGQGAIAFSATRRFKMAPDSLVTAGYFRTSIAFTGGKPVVSAGFNWVIR